MSVGEWIILGVAIVGIVGFVVVIAKELMKNKKLVNASTKDDENFFCYQGVVISKKVIGSRSEGLHQPKAIIEYGVYFLLKAGEEKLYLLPENVFNQLREGMRGNLYIKNNSYFDFEEIE